MSDNEIDDFKRKFVSAWSKSPEHEKIIFVSELNNIRTSSLRRISLIEKLEPYKKDYKHEKEKYDKSFRSAPIWMLGFCILMAIVDWFELSELSNSDFGIMGILFFIIFLCNMNMAYVGLKSLELTIFDIQSKIDDLDHTKFMTYVQRDLYKEMGSQSFDFSGLSNDLRFQKLKLYLLGSFRNSSVFE